MTSSNGWVNYKIMFAGALITLLASHTCYAGALTIGVAANFRSTLQQVANGYQSTFEKQVKIGSASTGALYAQAANGAPFDILFMADSERPRLLEEGGHSRLRKTYAYGQLAFWTPGQPASAQWLRDYTGTLAIANPKHAPYGQAAIETLNALQATKARLVFGTNVAQTFNFVMTGNAPAGMVALSQLRQLGMPETAYWLIPETFHQPIEQQLVVMKRASPEAELFLEYVFSPGATDMIRQSGYRTVAADQ